MPKEILYADPRTLRLYGRRDSGADPWRLQQRIAQFGKSLAGMPPLEAYRARDGHLLLYNGVTRATRAALLCPGQLVPVEVLGTMNVDGTKYPTVEERLP
jgi:hypothetical protein